jgi:AcrR family transcriptional regulator
VTAPDKKPRSDERTTGRDLKRELVDAALEVLAEKGEGELSLREVARRAGVSHNAPYHHYSRGKSQLFADVAAEGFERLRREMLKRTEVRGLSARERLEELAAVYVGFAFDNVPLYRVMFSSEVHAGAEAPGVQQSIVDLYDVFRRNLVEAQSDGTVHPAPADDLGTAYTTMLHGLAVGIVDGLVRRSAPSRRRAEDLAKRLARAMLGPATRRARA